MIEFLRGDTAILADLVYPLLAGACAMTSLLSFAWYVFTPKPRHTVHLFVSLVTLLIVVPALIASAATGDRRFYEIGEIRNMLRVGWLGVAIGFLSFASYYFVNFLHVWGLPFYRIGEMIDDWCVYLLNRRICAIFGRGMERS